jgi:PTS system mannose-specific IIA component
VNAAEMIVGDLPQFTPVSIGWHDDVNDAREDIAQAIERVRGEEGVLLLTDMFGGTPSNLGMTFLEKDRLEVITGVNLPMLIKLAGLRKSSDLLAVAKEMREHGRNAIWVASDFLARRKGSDVISESVTVGESARACMPGRRRSSSTWRRGSKRACACRASGARWTARASWGFFCSRRREARRSRSRRTARTSATP